VVSVFGIGSLDEVEFVELLDFTRLSPFIVGYKIIVGVLRNYPCSFFDLGSLVCPRTWGSKNVGQSLVDDSNEDPTILPSQIKIMLSSHSSYLPMPRYVWDSNLGAKVCSVIHRHLKPSPSSLSYHRDPIHASYILIPNTNQIILQSLHSANTALGCDAIRVMGEEEGLCCLCDDHAVFALFSPYGLVGCGDDGVFDAIDVEAGAVEWIWVREAIKEDFHFFRSNLEVGRSCPAVLSIDTKYSSAVDVASADEAGIDVCLPGHDE